MDLCRDDNGVWSVEAAPQDQESQPDFLAQFPRYLNAFDPLFEKAREANEFEFLMTLLGFRRMQAPGWNAYEATLRAVANLTRVHNQLPPEDAVAARHLKLWLYGHIVEASEPYEVLANLLEIATGGRFRIARYQVSAKRQVPSPGQKIERLATDTTKAEFVEIAEPLREIWDRELRNAIFHADYALHGVEVRLIGSQRSLTGAEVEALCARANAYHEALALLRRAHLESYTEPVTIPAQPFAPPPEQAVVIVRQGDGAVGLKDAWTAADRASGAIPFRLVVASYDDIAMLDADPDLALLPERKDAAPSETERRSSESSREMIWSRRSSMARDSSRRLRTNSSSCGGGEHRDEADAGDTVPSVTVLHHYLGRDPDLSETEEHSAQPKPCN